MTASYATCPVCQRDVPIRGAGFLAMHKGQNRKVTCPGSGRPVVETPEETR